MAATTGALGVIPVAMLASPVRPHGVAGVVVSVAITACGAVLAWLWATRWPTRTQAVTYALLATLCVAATCLVEADPLGAMMGCVTFAALGGFIAFYLDARYLVFNVVVAIGTAAWLAIRVAADGQPVLAMCKLLLIIVAILAVPLTGQTLVHLLGADAISSHLDPLTELHNRRAVPR